MTIPHRSLDDEHEISYEAEGVRFPDEEDEYEDQEVSQQIEVTFEDEADEERMCLEVLVVWYVPFKPESERHVASSPDNR